ncbi:MAG: hypothetical protein RLZZ387_2759 [Chloroflexota bacterium]
MINGLRVRFHPPDVRRAPLNTAGAVFGYNTHIRLLRMRVAEQGESMPKTTVAAIITRHDGSDEQVLLTRRAGEPFRGQWCLPGGHFDEYEPAVDAVAREVREETGLAFAPTFFRYFDEIIPEMQIHAVVLAFHGAAEGELVAQEEEVQEVEWFSLAEARAMPLAFRHAEIVAAFADAPRS